MGGLGEIWTVPGLLLVTQRNAGTSQSRGPCREHPGIGPGLCVFPNPSSKGWSLDSGCQRGQLLLRGLRETLLWGLSLACRWTSSSSPRPVFSPSGLCPNVPLVLGHQSLQDWGCLTDLILI